MNVIPPPPPGMSNPYSKHDGYEQINDRFRPKTQAKRKRTPVEDQGATIGVRIRDDGSRKYIMPPGLEGIALGPLKDLGDLLEEWLSVRSTEDSGRHRQKKKDGSLTGRKLKSTWNCEPVEQLPAIGSVSFPFQTTFKANGITNRSTKTMSDMSPPLELSYVQSAVGNPTAEEHLKGPIIRELAPVRPVLAIKVGDTARWEEWFHNAFKVIQQQQCRFIAKEWIKLIHPRKQSTHPYNGNFPRNYRASPERTKPPYWPKAVRHKEPDHIDKDSRTVLLVHLLMQTPQQEITPVNLEGRSGGKTIVAADLLGCLAKKRDELKDKWEILEQLIQARTQLEIFEDGGLDADTIVNVPDYHESARPGPNRKKSRARGREKSIEEQMRDCDSRAESPTPPTSPAATMIATPADSDEDEEEEENYKALNNSFSSDVTQMSSLSSTTALPVKYDDVTTAHFHGSSMSQPQPPLIMAQARQDEMDFARHDHVQHRQPMMMNPWPTTHAADPRLTSAFADDMMASQTSLSLPPGQFDHAMCATTSSPATSAMMYSMPYANHQHFAYEYHQNVARNMNYRPVADMGHEPGYGPQFALHEEYNNLYGPASRRLQR